MNLDLILICLDMETNKIQAQKVNLKKVKEKICKSLKITSLMLEMHPNYQINPKDMRNQLEKKIISH